MARPQKETVDYFPHEAIASDGTTLTILQSKFGNDGYAFWFKLLERLCSSKGHYIDCRNIIRWEFLLAITNVSAETGTAILGLLAELEAIDSVLWDEKVIWSQNLVENVSVVYKNRRLPLPQKPSINNQQPTTASESTDDNAASGLDSTEDNRQSIVEYSRVYNSIYTVWNNQTIIVHKKLTSDYVSSIKSALKDYDEDEIIKAIENYGIILKDDSYFFKYKWTLKEFLKRGLVKFLDLDIAKSNYLKESTSGTHWKGTPRSQVQRFTRPEEL